MSCFVFDQAHFLGNLGYPQWEPEWNNHQVIFPSNNSTFNFYVTVAYTEELHCDPWCWTERIYQNPWIPSVCRPTTLYVSLYVPIQGEYPTSDDIFFSVAAYDPVTGSGKLVATMEDFIPIQGALNNFELTLDWTGLSDESFIIQIGFETFLYSADTYFLTVSDSEQGVQQFWTSFNKTKELAE